MGLVSKGSDNEQPSMATHHPSAQYELDSFSKFKRTCEGVEADRANRRVSSDIKINPSSKLSEK